MGRFMEAMVVCKKGVKAHPNNADPRVLLARVYADQGKEKKAVEELNSALAVAPKDKGALRLMGSLQIKTGEGENGKSNLIKAYELDPTDADTLELFKQHNVPLPVKAAPVAAPPVLQPVANGNGANGASQAQGQAQRRPPTVPPGTLQTSAGPSVVGQPPAASTAQGQVPRPRPSQRRPAYVPPEDSQSGTYEASSELSEVPRRRGGKKGGSPTVTIALLLIALVGGGGFAFWRKWDAEKKAKAGKALRAAAGELKHDGYDSYKKAIAEADSALEAVSDSVAAHGMLAYAHAIRWGEHGGGDEDRKAAEEHLALGLKTGDRSVWLYAAESLIPFYSGNSKDALEKIKKRIEETNGRSGQLYLTQGIIMMNEGDLEGSREAIEKAQQINQDDARVYAAFGNLNRRRGLDREALQNFETAKRFERNHVDSILGTAMLVLDQPEPAGGYISQAKALKDVIDAQPPASPRQQALAYVIKSLLIARVAIDLPLYQDPEFQKKLKDGTEVGTDKDKNRAAVSTAETAGFNLDKNNPELFLVKGKRLFFEGRLDDSANEIRKAIAMSATRVHYRIELGKVLMAKEGAEKDAEAELRKSLSTFPDNIKLQTMLGSVLYKEKKIDEAVTVLEKATAPARNPETKQRNPEAFYMLGKIYRDEKKAPDKAIENLGFAGAQSFGNAGVASRVYDELAALYEAKNDKGAARGNYEKALNADGDNDAALCHFVKFLKKGGDAKDGDRIKDLTKKYLEVAPKGECAAELRGGG
ncbi:MAG: tetratricopeptide repeat protein [Archangiaceae bacterium]|nr:tetratricopeptide repeat protein [Archangiaceae bacterium]